MTMVVNASGSGWCVVGEIDAGTSKQLAATLGERADIGDDPVEIDLGGVTFIDSSGLRVLLEHSNRLRSRGHGLTIRNASRPVRRLLSITNLSELFGVDEDSPIPSN